MFNSYFFPLCKSACTSSYSSCVAFYVFSRLFRIFHFLCSRFLKFFFYGFMVIHSSSIVFFCFAHFLFFYLFFPYSCLSFISFCLSSLPFPPLLYIVCHSPHLFVPVSLSFVNIFFFCSVLTSSHLTTFHFSICYHFLVSCSLPNFKLLSLATAS